MRYSIPRLCAALSLTLLTGRALAEGLPDFDIEQTCRSSGRVQVGVIEEESKDGCLRSERAARDDLKRRWGEFSPDAKAQCSKQAVAGGFPSYVETVTCLELATGLVPKQTNSGGLAPKGAPTGNTEGSTLTAEPSAKQRTDPIEVLDKKP